MLTRTDNNIETQGLLFHGKVTGASCGMEKRKKAIAAQPLIANAMAESGAGVREHLSNFGGCWLRQHQFLAARADVAGMVRWKRIVVLTKKIRHALHSGVPVT